jgi:putative redox protein
MLGEKLGLHKSYNRLQWDDLNRSYKMPTATIRWVKDRQFVGMDANQHSLVLSGDTPPTGMRPSHLLLVALGTCSSIDLVGILKKKRIILSSLEIKIEGEQDPEPPWPYRLIRMSFRLSGEGLTEKAVAQAIKLSHERYCSVAATVRGVAEIFTDFEIVTPAVEDA